MLDADFNRLRAILDKAYVERGCSLEGFRRIHDLDDGLDWVQGMYVKDGIAKVFSVKDPGTPIDKLAQDILEGTYDDMGSR